LLLCADATPTNTPIETPFKSARSLHFISIAKPQIPGMTQTMVFEGGM